MTETKVNSVKGAPVMEAVITIKANTFDPEGNTILNALAHQGGYTRIKSLRVGTLVRVEFSAPTHATEKLAREVCDKAGLVGITNDINVQIPVEAGMKREDSAGNGFFTVDAVIRLREEVKSAEYVAILRTVHARGYRAVVASIGVAKMLRMQVEAGSAGEALVYVGEFSERRRVHNPIIHNLELRSV